MEKMTEVPKPLDRQLAEERARHPTVREAAKAGAAFGLIVGVVNVILNASDWYNPGSLSGAHAPPMRAVPGYVVVALVGSVIGGVVCCEIGATFVRWRRRLSVRIWHRDRAV